MTWLERISRLDWVAICSQHLNLGLGLRFSFRSRRPSKLNQTNSLWHPRLTFRVRFRSSGPNYIRFSCLRWTGPWSALLSSRGGILWRLKHLWDHILRFMPSAGHGSKLWWSPYTSREMPLYYSTCIIYVCKPYRRWDPDKAAIPDKVDPKALACDVWLCLPSNSWHGNGDCKLFSCRPKGPDLCWAWRCWCPQGLSGVVALSGSHLR